jgi:hypothetical protein
MATLQADMTLKKRPADRCWPIAACAGASGSKQTTKSHLPPTEFTGAVKQCRLQPSCLLPT